MKGVWVFFFEIALSGLISLRLTSRPMVIEKHGKTKNTNNKNE